jgi:multiple sugar transport system substrate-binding protein
MKRKRCLSIVLVYTVLLTTGCADIDKAEKNGAIKLYLMSHTKQFMTKATKEFTAKYPNNTLDVEYSDNQEEYRKKLNTELLAGRGPDIVLFDSYTFNSIYKTVNSGVFCDINPYIEADESFNMESYNKKVMDCGVYNGKRYIIPLEYYINMFITSEEQLRQNGISINAQEWDVKQLADILKTFIGKDKNSRPEFFFDMQSPFSDYVISSGFPFADYEKSKTYFNTPEFRELLNIYKDVFVKASATDGAREKYGFKYWEMLKGNVAIAAKEIYNINSVWVVNSFINSIFENKGRIYPFPPYDKTGGYVAMPYSMAAINSSSKHKNIAFDIIKYMLSKDLQLDNSFIPVNEEAYDEQMKEYKGEAGDNQSLNIKGTQLNTISISEELAGDLNDIKANLSGGVIRDAYIFMLMDEAAMKYAEGEYTEDRVVEELSNKVTLYLNE